MSDLPFILARRDADQLRDEITSLREELAASRAETEALREEALKVMGPFANCAPARFICKAEAKADIKFFRRMNRKADAYFTVGQFREARAFVEKHGRE